MSDYKQWLDNEYKLWIEALQQSTVNNFKLHPQVKRMLGEVPGNIFNECIAPGKMSAERFQLLCRIDQIGFDGKHEESLSGHAMRLIHWAIQILRKKPESIVEIGGGVGQLYATLRALGYKGIYSILDLERIRMFQETYLKEVSNATGLDTSLLRVPPLYKDAEMVVSLYALGEFDEMLKKLYFDNVISECPHGFILWNPHSGASNDTSLFKHKVKIELESPCIHPGNFKITW